MVQPNDQKVQKFLEFIFDAPEDEDFIDMDCNDHCENLARLAELVAAGNQVKDLLPALERFMHYWTDCREEFEALVAVLRAEQEGQLTENTENID